MGHMKYIIMAYLTCLPFASAKVPTWAQSNTLTKNGNTLMVVCNGTGPSVETARKDAIFSCKSSASQYLTKRTQIKSLSVQTEKSVGLHEEVVENSEIIDLTCIPRKDEIVDEGNGKFSSWIRCEFDLSKSKVVESKSEKDTNETESTVSSLKSADHSTVGSDIVINTLIVSSVPKCESILVQGNKSRTVQCATNPQSIQLDEGDKIAIVRARGYLPKTLDLKGKRNESVNVILEKN